MEDLSKMHVATGRLHVQARFKKDAYFLVPFEQRIQENDTLSMDRQLIRVPLPVA